MSDTLTLALWLVKATVLLVLAMGLTAALRRAPAGARYLVWLLTLVALLFVPPISSWSPLPVPILPGAVAEASLAEVTSVGTVQQQPSATNRSATFAAPNAVPTSRTNPTMSAAQIVFTIWATITVLVLAWLLVAALAVRRILRGARVLADESWLSPMYDVADRLDLQDAPRIVMSSAIEMPFACGILRPTIVLPAGAATWSDERRRCVLFHELAHVRRRDLLGHTIGRIVCAFYWFHPLVWSAAKRLRAESERACDDLVLACGSARASEYANHLLEIVTAVRSQGAPATALPMADKGEFEGRMLAILDPAIARSAPSRPKTAALVTALAALSLSIAAAAPTRRTPTPTPERQTAGAGQQLRQTHATVSETSIVTRTIQTASLSERTRTTSTADTPDSRAMPLVQQGPVNQQNAAPRPQPEQKPAFVQSREQPIDTAVLGRVLREDKDPSVRKAAAWALQGHREGMPLLLERLRIDTDTDVREMAAWALVGLGGSDVTAALETALRNDKSEEVRATAAWGLGHYRSANVALLEAALSDASPEVRQRALWAIGQHGLSTAPAKVVALLQDDRDEVRLMAAWVLGEILDKSTIPALEAAFEKETDSNALRAEFRGLLFMDYRSQPFIDRALNHPDPEIRARAVRAIAGQGSGSWPWPWPWPEPRPWP